MAGTNKVNGRYMVI